MTLLTAIQRDPTTNSYIFKLYTIVNVLITIILSCEKKECKKRRWLDFKILSRLTFPAAVGHTCRAAKSGKPIHLYQLAALLVRR